MGSARERRRRAGRGGEELGLSSGCEGATPEVR